MKPQPPHTWNHPLKLHDTYRLLNTFPLANKSNDELELLADRLANVRSLLELNRLIRQLRQNSDENAVRTLQSTTTEKQFSL